MKNLPNQNGMTMIEVAVGAAISSLVVLGLIQGANLSLSSGGALAMQKDVADVVDRFAIQLSDPGACLSNLHFNNPIDPTDNPFGPNQSQSVTYTDPSTGQTYPNSSSLPTTPNVNITSISFIKLANILTTSPYTFISTDFTTGISSTAQPMLGKIRFEFTKVKQKNAFGATKLTRELSLAIVARQANGVSPWLLAQCGSGLTFATPIGTDPAYNNCPSATATPNGRGGTTFSCPPQTLINDLSIDSTDSMSNFIKSASCCPIQN
jgi:hypothetical protein